MRKDAGGYIILGGFEQRPWTPTKRRGPIALEMASPGPACVQLPQLLGKFRQLNVLNFPTMSFVFHVQ